MDNIVFAELSPAEKEAVRAVLFSLRAIEAATGHGAVEINIAENKIVQVDTSIRIRPQIAAPWRP